ncbi:MAG: hypothetical protein KME46_12055 [Brasilonema angustatum HA4187-MV1]|nr:hypothetical protein [Brasilonema angustatum HA4187-MV1]
MNYPHQTEYSYGVGFWHIESVSRTSFKMMSIGQGCLPYPPPYIPAPSFQLWCGAYDEEAKECRNSEELFSTSDYP